MKNAAICPGVFTTDRWDTTWDLTGVTMEDLNVFIQTMQIDLSAVVHGGQPGFSGGSKFFLSIPEGEFATHIISSISRSTNHHEIWGKGWGFKDYCNAIPEVQEWLESQMFCAKLASLKV